MRFSSQVKTTPSPQIVVRKVTKETASERLAKVSEDEWWVADVQKKLDVQERWYGDAAAVHPAEDSRGLTGARKREQHTAAREEAGVRRREHGGEQHGVDDVDCRTEPGSLEDHREGRRSNARVLIPVSFTNSTSSEI